MASKTHTFLRRGALAAISVGALTFGFLPALAVEGDETASDTSTVTVGDPNVTPVVGGETEETVTPDEGSEGVEDSTQTLDVVEASSSEAAEGEDALEEEAEGEAEEEDAERAAGDSQVVVTQKTGTLAKVPVLNAEGSATYSNAQTGAVPLTDEVWDAQDGQGYDSGADNEWVRTNDYVLFDVDVSSPQGTSVETPTITVELAQGLEIVEMPAVCGAGSALGDLSGDPVVPVTKTSYLDLKQQTLTCVVDSVPEGGAKSFPFKARVRPEMPNATDMTTIITVSDKGGVQVGDAQEMVQKVSAGARWDLSINGATAVANTASIREDRTAQCVSNDQQCYVAGFPVTLSVAAPGGKGVSPIESGTVSFEIDASAATAWGDPAISDAVGGGVWRKATNPQGYGLPYAGMGIKGSFGVTTAMDAVRTRGTWDITQTSPGAPVKITVSNLDTSAYTVPERAHWGGTLLREDRGFVAAMIVFVEYPTKGLVEANPGVERIVADITGKIQNLTFKDLEGDTSNVSAPNDTIMGANDYRSSKVVIEAKQVVSNFWAGVPFDATTTPAGVFNPSYAVWQGPSGDSGLGKGNGVAVPGQNVIDTITLAGNLDMQLAQGSSTLACLAIDTNNVAIANGQSYTQAKAPDHQFWTPTEGYKKAPEESAKRRSPDGGGKGSSVWVSGGIFNYNPASGAHDSTRPDMRFGDFKAQYANLGSSDSVACGNAAGDWKDDPADVLGNDPALAAKGVYTGVTHMRVFLQNRPWVKPGAAQQWTSISTMMQVLPDATPGNKVLTKVSYVQEIAPWEAGVSDQEKNTMLQNRTTTLVPFETLAERSDGWVLSTYDGTAKHASKGDRLTITKALARVDKTVVKDGKDITTNYWKPTTELWEDTVAVKDFPKYTVNDTITYKLQPSLSAETVLQPGQSSWFTVEDCLPAGLQYDEAGTSPKPSQVGNVNDSKTRLACDSSSGETYLRWEFEDVPVNGQMDDITLAAKVLPTAKGVYTNQASAMAEKDFSLDDQRSDRVKVNVQPKYGIQLAKKAMTPEVTVTNGIISATQVHWNVEMRNTYDNSNVRGFDVIDRLPKLDVNDTTAAGTHGFMGASTDDPDTTILYTSADSASINTDPKLDASAWCTAPVGGTLTLGAGACPASLSEVTALRFVRTTELVPDEAVFVNVYTDALGNANGTEAVNYVEGRSESVPTVTFGQWAARTRFLSDGSTAGAISGNVWNDTNRNGVKDPGEVDLGGVTVEVRDASGKVIATGVTDSRGNYSLAVPGVAEGETPLTYTVVATAPAGMSGTTPGTRSVVVSADAPRGVADFGFASGGTPTTPPTTPPGGGTPGTPPTPPVGGVTQTPTPVPPGTTPATPPVAGVTETPVTPGGSILIPAKPPVASLARTGAQGQLLALIAAGLLLAGAGLVGVSARIRRKEERVAA
ncbi:MAG: SdrD B-like domain-containing protein [Actinomycetaceae bacterium]|nr:SdrD B-like domain-containing protein [Actinomycetaceae bacterium]